MEFIYPKQLLKNFKLDIDWQKNNKLPQQYVFSDEGFILIFNAQEAHLPVMWVDVVNIKPKSKFPTLLCVTMKMQKTIISRALTFFRIEILFLFRLFSWYFYRMCYHLTNDVYFAWILFIYTYIGEVECKYFIFTHFCLHVCFLIPYSCCTPSRRLMLHVYFNVGVASVITELCYFFSNPFFP